MYISLKIPIKPFPGRLNPAIRSYDFPFGKTSILQKPHESDAKILFLGTAWDTCTALQYTEHLLSDPIPTEMRYNGKRFTRGGFRVLGARVKSPLWNNHTEVLMSANPRHSPKDIARFLDLLEQSGLSTSEFARRNSLKLPTLYKWKLKMATDAK